MKNHTFNFPGGDILSKMGASWFISYFYYLKVDKSHDNWKRNKTCRSRINNFQKSKVFHNSFVREILNMSDAKLATNKIGLSAKEVKTMAKALSGVISPSNGVSSVQNHTWTFEENFICCILYIQTYIIKKKNTSVSDLIKIAIPLLPGFSDKDPTNTLRQKFQNIKAIAASTNLTDTFPSDERPNASTDNKIAFEKAYDILI